MLSEHLKYVLVMELKTCDANVGQAQRGVSEDPSQVFKAKPLGCNTHTPRKGTKKRQRGRDRDTEDGNRWPPAPSFEKWK